MEKIYRIHFMQSCSAAAYCLIISSALLLLHTSLNGQSEQQASIERYLEAGVKVLNQLEVTPGHEAFAAFQKAIVDAAKQDGNDEIAGKLRELESDKPASPQNFLLASLLLRRYMTAYYGKRIVTDLQHIVKFRTHAQTNVKNWDAPEFLKQRKWLEQRAQEMGFTFRSFDGRVEEITLTGSEPILAILTHGDVQGIEEQVWSSPPWEARIVDGRIIGRGAEDDKGAIIVTLYAMAALRDVGFPLKSSIRLLIANGEESDWSDIPYYLERAQMPDVTLGIDASYPVTHAQKGFGIVTIKAEAGSPDSLKGMWEVISLSGGSGLSIIPERGEAELKSGGNSESALNDLTDLAREWSAAHPPAKLSVSREGDLFKVSAEGVGGHSSEPKNGHNALGDLTAFLATLDLKKNSLGALISFIGTHIGTEINGVSLGIAHSDSLLGELTYNLAVITKDTHGVFVRSSIRIPRGITGEEIASRIRQKVESFNLHSKTRITVEFQQATQPHIADDKLVAALLSVWDDVTGKPGKPIAIGGGTQARFFKGGVDFGPGFPDVKYRGHGPDEYLTVDELMRISELTIAALWKLAGKEQ